MDALIRSATVADGKRQLRRPVTPHATAGAVAVPDAGTSVAVPDQAERLRLEIERGLADGKRELERERAVMRETMATEQAAAIARATEQGYQDGSKRGEAQGKAALDAAAARLGGVVDALLGARQAVLDDAEDVMVEIVFAAVARMVGDPAGGRQAAVHAVRRAAQDLRADDVLHVLVHPDDLAFMTEHAGMPTGFALAAGSTVALGGCLIDSATGTLDARLETQLERLRAALAEARSLRRPGEQA